MVNTRILASEFEYFEPRTINEAVNLLAKYGQEARVLAGGSDLIVDMKVEKVNPKYLIYIGKIPELRSIAKVGNEVVVGANATFFDLIKSPLLQSFPILLEALKSIQLEIKMMGTIGGNICSAAPTASTATPLLVLNAWVKVVSARGSRTIPIEKVYVGNRKTSLAPDELLTEIHLPVLDSRYGTAFGEIKTKIKFAVVIGRRGDVCEHCRIAIGGDVEVAKRVEKAEKLLEGKVFNERAIEEACDAVVEEIDPDNWYVREVAKYLFPKVVREAWEKAR
jgi:carbon-monoxide dehydrogenase medium subunit